jgi:hypothetical protein
MGVQDRVHTAVNAADESPDQTRQRLGASWIADESRFQGVGVSVPRKAVDELLADHGFQKAIPRLQSSFGRATLNKAARTGRKPKGYEVGRVEPMADAEECVVIYAITKREGEVGDKREAAARVRLVKTPNAVTGQTEYTAVACPAVDEYGQDKPVDSTAQGWAEQIAERCNRTFHYVDTAELHDRLRNAAYLAGGVKSLFGGNDYYFTPGDAQAWYDFITVAAHKFNLTLLREAKRDDQPGAVAVIQASASQSLEQDIAKLCEDLQTDIKAQGGKRKMKAKFTGRLQRADELRARARVMRSFLSGQVSKFTDLLDEHSRLFQRMLDGGQVTEDEGAELASQAGVEQAPEPDPSEPEAAPSGAEDLGSDAVYHPGSKRQSEAPSPPVSKPEAAPAPADDDVGW